MVIKGYCHTRPKFGTVHDTGQLSVRESAGSAWTTTGRAERRFSSLTWWAIINLNHLEWFLDCLEFSGWKLTWFRSILIFWGNWNIPWVINHYIWLPTLSLWFKWAWQTFEITLCKIYVFRSIFNHGSIRILSPRWPNNIAFFRVLDKLGHITVFSLLDFGILCENIRRPISDIPILLSDEDIPFLGWTQVLVEVSHRTLKVISSLSIGFILKPIFLLNQINWWHTPSGCCL